MFAPDDDLHLARKSLIARDALIEDFQKTRLLLKGAEQLAHSLGVGKLRLRQNIRCAVNINVRHRCLFTFKAAVTEQHGVAQQLVVESFFGAHQLDDLGANRRQALAAKLRVQITRRLLKLFLRQIDVNVDDLVLAGRGP